MTELTMAILAIALSAIMAIFTINYTGPAYTELGSQLTMLESQTSNEQWDAMVQAWQANNNTETLPTCQQLKADGWIGSKVECQ